MSPTSPSSESNDLETIDEMRSATLIRANEALREETQRLIKENERLSYLLAEATVDSQSDREVRRAAVKLFEDAESARQSETREKTERRRVEEELRQANRRKDEFLATLAHELRNPLAPIRNSLHLLQLAGPDSGVSERVRQMLERQVNHMVRLVDDLLEVSRITRGRIELRMEPVDLAAIVRSALEASKPLIEASHQELAMSLPSEPVTLLGDPIRLAQVLSNLLNNAAKYTNDGGHIWLSARRDGEHVNISVRDSGEGIPSDMLPHVFELFTQIDRTLGRAQGGLGIGLSLVRSLVEAHGGTVSVQSKGIGHGSEFTVRLPLNKSRLHHEQHVSPKDMGDLFGPHRILVVDDNRDAAESMTMLLKTLGAEVFAVFDGKTALEAIYIFKPTVMLVDLGMPGMDGLELARRVRHLANGDSIKLIALTGWGQDEDRRRTSEAGFDYHLVKPAELRKLNDIMAVIGRPPPQTRDSEHTSA